MSQNLAQFAPLLFMLVACYFLLLRPQQKKVQAQQAMHAALQTGDEVVTTGGLVGRVMQIKNEKELLVEVGPETQVRILKTAVSERIVQPQNIKAEAKKSPAPSRPKKKTK